jgi:uncharacterized membrane protein
VGVTEQNTERPMSDNPEQATTTGQLAGVRSVAAGRGLSWFGEGLELFKLAPWIWILNVVLFFIILALLNAIPMISILTSLLTPVFVGGLMVGCRDLDLGQRLRVAHLFAGFQNRAGALIGLGAINVILTILIVGVVFGVMLVLVNVDLETLDAWESGQIHEQQMLAMLLVVLLVMLFMLPLIMLFWFAPTLIVLHDDVGILEAMRLSFFGCLKNILPFLIYGIVGMILMILASIPFGLGWLVLGPVLFGSIYASYKQIFLD